MSHWLLAGPIEKCAEPKRHQELPSTVDKGKQEGSILEEEKRPSAAAEAEVMATDGFGEDFRLSAGALRSGPCPWTAIEFERTSW